MFEYLLSLFRPEQPPASRVDVFKRQLSIIGNRMPPVRLCPPLASALIKRYTRGLPLPQLAPLFRLRQSTQIGMGQSKMKRVHGVPDSPILR
jgi:hypothetical protein